MFQNPVPPDVYLSVCKILYCHQVSIPTVVYVTTFRDPPEAKLLCNFSATVGGHSELFAETALYIGR